MHQIISLVLFITGLVLFFAPDYILVKDSMESQNSIMKQLYEYHQILGFGVIVIAYYIYTLQKSGDDLYTTESIGYVESISNKLPSSEKITELS